MGLIDSLRHAEQQAAKSARRGADLAKAGMQAAEASVVRRVSRHRKTSAPRPPASAHVDPEQERDIAPAPKVRTGIVSVNGEDVGKMRCTGQ